MRKTLLSCLAILAMLFAGSQSGFALTTDEQGVYQIATVDDLLDFADLVNAGETSINGVLTADIDVDGETYTPIGNVENPYKGTFDGQGHTIKNLYIDSNEIGVEEYLGAFGVLTGGAHIKNLIIGGGEDAFIGGTRYVGGIAGGTNGKGAVTIENCGNEAWIYTTEQNAAGILGVDMNSEADVTILNCYNTGTIQAARESAAICGWIGDNGVCKGCWNTYDFEGGNGCDTGRPFCRYNGCEFENNWDVQGKQTDAGINVISASDLEGMGSGEFCYRVLNQTLTENVGWYQAIGTDEHPYPFASHGTVYAVGDLKCDGTSKGGETTYSNSPSGNRDAHNFENGACTVCDEWDPDYMTPDADDFYNLATSADLYWFARLVNQKEKNTANARLTADIVYDKQVRMGDTYNYMGTFDGQEHTINFNFTGDADKLAFIKNMEDATVENLILKGSIESTTHFCASIVSEAYGASVINNVIADVNIIDLYEGDGTHGGLVAVGHGTLSIENCAFTGSLYAPYSEGSGGIMGWSGDGQDIRILNSYVSGELTLKEGSNNIVIARNNPYIENCWVSSVNEKYDKNNYTTFFEPEALASGKLCYQDLNQTATTNVAWYQTLGTDSYPVPFSTHGTVYVAGAQKCDGTPKGETTGYSNNPEGDRDPHSYADGFCSVCGAVDPNYMTADADGYFDIANDAQLLWFIRYTKTQDTKAANARLTADINYTGSDMFGVDRCYYAGTFDGQEHTITVKFSKEDSRAALFDMISGATIQNLVIDGSVETAGQYAAGLAVESYGPTLIKNVIVKATIESTYEGDPTNENYDGTGDGTHGGIVAIGHDNMTIENCAFVGTLEAPACYGCGGIMAYTHGGSNTTIKNCYVAGEMDVLEGNNNITICRNKPYVVNCYASWDVSYYDNNDGVQYFETNEEMTSGELCYNLGNDVWFQTLDTDEYPVPFASHKKVYGHGTKDCSGKTVDAITYSNEEGTITTQNHHFVNGVCDQCNNAYQIADAAGLVAFAETVKNGAGDAYAELSADIDLSGVEYLPIGGRTDEEGILFQGTFDGMGHKISNMVINNELNNQGLFGAVGDGACIKNVVVDNTCSVTANGYAGGLIGATQGSGTITIENCGNEADVTVTEANAAGILGVDDLGQMNVIMTNCYTTGTITGGRESAAIAGWLSAHSVLANVWNSGEVSGLDGSNTFARSDNGAATYKNCYETIGSQVNTTTDEDVENGKLCFLLNGKQSKNVAWYQTIGTDAHPVFDAAHGVVYQSEDGYTNDSSLDGVESISTSTASPVAIYSVGGAKSAKMQKGINIVRMSDGSVRKVLVK